MASSYDNQSFLSGIAIGRQLKGWATGKGSGGGTEAPDSFDTIVSLPNSIVAENIFCEFDTYNMLPYPVACSFAEA